MEPKLLNYSNLSDRTRAVLMQQGIDGIVDIRRHQANISLFTGESATVSLTSAAVWLVVVSEYNPLDSFTVFTEQHDQELPSGAKPWELLSGHAEPDDIDIYDTARREVSEESGGYEPEGILPIAIAINNGERGVLPNLRLLSNAGSEVLVARSTLFQSPVGNLKGGLICLSMASMNEFMRHFRNDPFLKHHPHFPFPDGVDITPSPIGVDVKEISNIAFVPIKNLLTSDFPDEGSMTYEILCSTRRYWARIAALMAFRDFMGVR